MKPQAAPYWCPRCHRPIIPPAMLKNIKAEGNIRLECGNCKKGAVVLHGNVPKTDEASSWKHASIP